MTMNRGGCGPRCGMRARFADEESWAVIEFVFAAIIAAGSLTSKSRFAPHQYVSPGKGGPKTPGVKY